MSAEILSKDVEYNLTELNPGLDKVTISFGWEAPLECENGQDFDIDASAFLLNRSGEVRYDEDFVFYNNLKDADECLIHTGDNLGKKSDERGNKESFSVNLVKLPFDIEKILFAVSIHNSNEREQTFDIVKNVFLSIIDPVTDEEIARYSLNPAGAGATGISFGEIYRELGSGWNFKGLAEIEKNGLFSVARKYRVNVADPE